MQLKKSQWNASCHMCFCLSFGNGDEHIEKARAGLKRRYAQLAYFMESPNSQPHARTISRYLNEVQDKEKKWQTWLQEYTGYPLEQLNNPPESDTNLMSEDELKLATEYHQWQSAWYLVRFIALHKAAEREGKIDDTYPNKYECRGAAIMAFRNWKHHDDIYLQYLKALDENVRKYLLKHKFSSYVHSQEQYYKNPLSSDILNVMIHLEDLIKGLLRRKNSMNTSPVKDYQSIALSLTPSGGRMNMAMMPKLRNCFSVEDLSQLTDSSDLTFLEVGWLFNRYRSLRHEIRYHEFQKFSESWKQCATGFTRSRLLNAIQEEKANSIHFGSLAVNYYESFNKYKPDRRLIAQDTPHSSEFMKVGGQIHTSEDEGLEKRKNKQKKALKRVRKMVSKPLDASKRFKCLEADTKTGIDQEQQHKSLNVLNRSQFDFDLPTTDLSNEGEPAPLSMDVILFQLASESLNPPFLENNPPHSLVTDTEGPSTAGVIIVENFQENRPLSNLEKQLETNGLEVEEQQESFSLNEIQESEYSGFDSWLKNFLEHEIPGGSAVHEMTLFGQSGALGPDILDGAGGPNFGFPNIIEKEFAEERQGRVEWNTNIGVHERDGSLYSDIIQ